MSKLIKLNANRATQVIGRYELDEDLEHLLQPDMTPGDFIRVLIEQKQYLECVRFLAHALPKREGIWWACLATRFTHTPDTEALRQQTLKVTESWVRNPTEELRKQAEKLAALGKYKTPDSWAATAAFWSVGSISNEDAPPMPAPPYLYAHAVSGAIGLAAVADSEDEINSRYQRFLSQGLDLASGGKGMVHEDLAPLLDSPEQKAVTA
ncbi:hypothetical protein PAHA111176_22070 [Parendozoicomonas haliclonae]|uniref:Uncharacterized protein n=2 Tax=Parendozoicomonas haliclonae TaxID=1960125 RepID=A0A1X7AR71_9GAMM|nr:hypothetical protein EHSB41UT_04459 [Parendozoicomonas haliclonae]